MFNFDKAVAAFLLDAAPDTRDTPRFRRMVPPDFGLSWQEAVDLLAHVPNYVWPDDLEGYKADDCIAAIADTAVSVYTFDRYQWAAEHFGRVDMADGAEMTDSRDPADIIAAAWYCANYDTLRQLIDEIAVEYAGEESARTDSRTSSLPDSSLQPV